MDSIQYLMELPEPQPGTSYLRDAEVASALGHATVDDTTPLLRIKCDGMEYELRIVGTPTQPDGDPYFEWINDIGDPVGDIKDTLQVDPAQEIKQFLSMLHNPVGTHSTPNDDAVISCPSVAFF